MTPEEKRERQREYDRRFAERHPERRRAQEHAKSRRWNEANRDRVLETNRIASAKRHLRMHGLDGAGLAALRQEQNDLCYLCREPLTSGIKVHIDHDHACCTGGSCIYCRRGLACSRCNVLIGLAQDDPALLRKIADNLEPVLAATRERLTARPVQGELL